MTYNSVYGRGCEWQMSRGQIVLVDQNAIVEIYLFMYVCICSSQLQLILVPSLTHSHVAAYIIVLLHS